MHGERESSSSGGAVLRAGSKEASGAIAIMMEGPSNKGCLNDGTWY